MNHTRIGRQERIGILQSIGCVFYRCPRTGRIICATSRRESRAFCTCEDRWHTVRDLKRATIVEYVDQESAN